MIKAVFPVDMKPNDEMAISAQVLRENTRDIPNAFRACVDVVPDIPHIRVAVVDFEKSLAFHLRQLLRRDAPAEVRMIDVRNAARSSDSSKGFAIVGNESVRSVPRFA